jgi:hypothetical protein
LVVVSLGTNHAAIPNSIEQYRSNNRALLTELAALTPRSAVAAIPPPEVGLEEAKKGQRRRNRQLQRDLARAR